MSNICTETCFVEDSARMPHTLSHTHISLTLTHSYTHISLMACAQKRDFSENGAHMTYTHTHAHTIQKKEKK